MTAIQFILIAIAALIVLAGLIMVMRSFKRRKNAEAAAVNYDKNGIPIIPRHERNIVDQPDLDDTIAGETSITPDRSYLNAVVEDASLSQARQQDDVQLMAGYDNVSRDVDDSYSQVNDEDYARWQAEQQHADNSELVEVPEQRYIEQEPDAFSSLVSATDSLMPSIDPAEEPSFNNNSPILDQHL